MVPQPPPVEIPDGRARRKFEYCQMCPPKQDHTQEDLNQSNLYFQTLKEILKASYFLTLLDRKKM